MFDYRIHYAQLVAEDRLRRPRSREERRPAIRVFRRSAADAASRR